MVIKDIQEYGEIRTKARAYLCYMFRRNLPTKLPDITIDRLIEPLKKLSEEMGNFESVYILDPSGTQVTNTVSVNPEYARRGMGEGRSNRAYYYRTLAENRCTLTDPYPSLDSNELVVTATYPIHDENGNLIYIVCVDISLQNILKAVHPTSIESLFGKARRGVYAAFSFALSAVALFMFFKGISHFFIDGLKFEEINIGNMFEATILLTLSLAIFDLVRAIFEEEVLGSQRKHEEGDIHKTMVRFLGSIIIALAIEALMLVFKFAITAPDKLLFAVYLIGGISVLLISLSIYLKAMHSSRHK